jgi:hypothetical protein
MVVFMDELCFTWEAIFTSHNCHVWAEANLHAASSNALW